VNSTTRVRAIVADCDFVIRTGLVTMLETVNVKVVGAAVNGAQAIEMAGRLRPDLVLLNVRMPVVDGPAVARQISTFTRVLMVAYETDAKVIKSAIRNGSAGYLVHGSLTAEQLRAAVHDVVTGRANPLSPAASKVLVEACRDTPQNLAAEPAHPPRHSLTARETEVMNIIARGHSNGDIARELCLSENTVKNHVNRIFAKLGVTTRASAMAWWFGTYTMSTE
jgi:DNA-binding NarL/FixJ family response regulator